MSRRLLPAVRCLVSAAQALTGRCVKLSTILVFSVLGATTSPCFATTYTVTGLGFLPADATSSTPVSSIATAVSADGNAVGYTTFADGSTAATYWTKSGAIIGLGGTNSKAYGINDSAGFIVGEADGQPVVWTPGANVLPSVVGGQANGVNNSGVIVGFSGFEPFASELARIWFPDNTSLNVTQGYGSAINNHNDLVGRAANGAPNGFARVQSQLKLLQISPTSLNDSGVAAGVKVVNGHTVAAFQNIATSQATVIGTLGGVDGASFALGINNFGTIVGVSGTKGTLDPGGSNTVFGMSDGNAFIYDTIHGMRTVGSLLDPATPWEIWSANAINNNGQIVGWGVLNHGQQEAVLLTPTPEPSTLALTAIGALALLIRGRCNNPRRRDIGCHC